MLPKVLADFPLHQDVIELTDGKVAMVPWESSESSLAAEIEAVYTFGHPRVDESLLAKLPKVRVISNYGVGVDHINLTDARNRNIPVGNTPNVLNGATADMAWTLLLATARRLVEGDHYARSSAFTKYDPGYMLGTEAHSQTIGIIGMGRIGQEIAKRAVGFDMKIVYHNRKRNEEAEKRFGASYLSLDQLLQSADFVVLSCPLTAETVKLISTPQFELMKNSAILVNVARGPVVDTDALTKAIESGRIGGAGLDVTDPEPLPRNHPLLSRQEVVIAPHLGSATRQTRRKMAEISVENLLLGLSGKTLRFSV